MKLLVSDSSVLIELSKRQLLARMFELHFPILRCRTLLFEEELIDLGVYSRQDLLGLGLQVEALDPDGVATAMSYQSRRPALSLVDSFALALANLRGWETPDRRQRYAQPRPVRRHPSSRCPVGYRQHERRRHITGGSGHRHP